MPDSLLDVSEEQLLKELSDGISDYLHGDAREHVANSIAGAGEEVDDTIAALGYQTLSEVSGQIEEISPQLLTLDTLIPLATEAIDYLVEIAEAVNAPVKDVQDLRERSFIKMLEIHMAAVEDDPEQREIAQEMFAEFLEDGTFGEAEKYISEKIRAEGGDPARAQQTGAEMLQQPADPLTQGIQQGMAEDPGMMPQGGGLL